MIRPTGLSRHIFLAAAWTLLALIFLSTGCSIKIQKKALHKLGLRPKPIQYSTPDAFPEPIPTDTVF